MHLPIKIIVPTWFDFPINKEYIIPISDIILPGIILGYLEDFDRLELAEHANYYYIGISAVFFGLVLHILVQDYVLKISLPTIIFTLTTTFILLFIDIYQRDNLDLFINGMRKSEERNSLIFEVNKGYRKGAERDFELRSREGKATLKIINKTSLQNELPVKESTVSLISRISN